MKIALLSGAYKNAGDFLIEQRSYRLLHHILPHAEIEIKKRNIAFDNQIDTLNSYDVLVFGGGPGYQKKLYPKAVPFVKKLDKIEVPVMILGWGCKGKLSEVEKRNFNFSADMLEFLGFIEKSGLQLGCRDWNSINLLKQNNINSVIMTGCPAWYEVEKIEKLTDLQYVNKYKKEFNNIIISDAAFDYNKKSMRILITFLRNKFPESSIKVLFHRGINGNEGGIIEENFLQKYKITYEDISGSALGFSAYDTCDLHIGYRVHAHIYNLSIGNISILINEDIRGIGVNEALGIKNLNLNCVGQCGTRILNDNHLEIKLAEYFDYIVETGFLQYKTSNIRMQFYYEQMKKHILMINEILK